jgi:hypothetical protein
MDSDFKSYDIKNNLKQDAIEGQISRMFLNRTRSWVSRSKVNYDSEKNSQQRLEIVIYSDACFKH